MNANKDDIDLLIEDIDRHTSKTTATLEEVLEKLHKYPQLAPKHFCTTPWSSHWDVVLS